MSIVNGKMEMWHFCSQMFFTAYEPIGSIQIAKSSALNSIPSSSGTLTKSSTAFLQHFSFIASDWLFLGRTDEWTSLASRSAATFLPSNTLHNRADVSSFVSQICTLIFSPSVFVNSLVSSPWIGTIKHQLYRHMNVMLTINMKIFI